VEWSKTSSSIVRKQNQRKAMFSEMARHRRRNEVMLYSAEMSIALTITSGWIAGLPLSME
jgi:hypothetical protein